MSQMLAGTIPTFTVGDRLRKARECTGLDQAAFAAELGVSRQTVSNNESGRTHPSRLVIRQWSLRTGVPLAWLESGKVPAEGGGGGGVQPSDMWPALTLAA